MLPKNLKHSKPISGIGDIDIELTKEILMQVEIKNE